VATDVLDVLRAQLREAEDTAGRLRTAIAALEGAGMGRGGRRKGAGRRRGRPRKASGGDTVGNGRKKRRRFSAATRAKMASAQKARWAKRKKEKD
jgi:hypothetical protein